MYDDGVVACNDDGVAACNDDGVAIIVVEDDTDESENRNY